jgi:hypothetical protein
MAKDKTDPINSVLDSIISMTAMIGIGSIMYKVIGTEMDKMFGETIPKGVVKEMMEGVVSGLIGGFESKLYDKDLEIKKLSEKVGKLEEENETLKTKVEELTPKKK